MVKTATVWVWRNGSAWEIFKDKPIAGHFATELVVGEATLASWEHTGDMWLRTQAEINDMVEASRSGKAE